MIVLVFVITSYMLIVIRYSTGTVQVQYRYSTGTVQVQYRYSTGTVYFYCGGELEGKMSPIGLKALPCPRFNFHHGSKDHVWL